MTDGFSGNMSESPISNGTGSGGCEVSGVGGSNPAASAEAEPATNESHRAFLGGSAKLTTQALAMWIQRAGRIRGRPRSRCRR